MRCAGQQKMRVEKDHECPLELALRTVTEEQMPCVASTELTYVRAL